MGGTRSRTAVSASRSSSFCACSSCVAGPPELLLWISLVDLSTSFVECPGFL